VLSVIRYNQIPRKFKFRHIFNARQKTNTSLYNNYIIDDVSILTWQDEIHSGILEEDVDINMVKCFFTNGIWKSLMKIINIKRKKVVWLCPTCQKDISLKKSILCDSCLTWFHVKCDICI